MSNVSARLNRRLLPLYAAAFLHGFILWYAIEKLFMGTIGFDDAGIGVMAAVYSFIMLFFEAPSGILADRWSRKGVLIVASVFLAISSLLCGLSSEPILYIIGAGFWGIFYAFYSGTYDSVVYDTVQEEAGNSDHYGTYLGRIKIADSTALVIGGLAGGLISQIVSLQATYFLTIPISLAAIVALCIFKEPQLHKAEPLGTIRQQLRATYRAVLGRRTLLPLLGVVVMLTLIIELLFEFSQLWLTATHVMPAWYGPAFALAISSTAIGGYMAGKTERSKTVTTLVAYTCLVLAALALTFVYEFAAIVAAQTTLGAAATLLTVIFTKELHDRLPSKIRAGAASAVNATSRLIFVLLALGFGAFSTAYGVFNAAWMHVVVAVLIVACGLVHMLRPTTKI